MDCFLEEAVFVAGEVVEGVELFREPAAVEELFVGQCAEDLADEQVVGLHFEYLDDATFEMAGALLNQGRFDQFSGGGRQAALFELVDLPA